MGSFARKGSSKLPNWIVIRCLQSILIDHDVDLLSGWGVLGISLLAKTVSFGYRGKVATIQLHLNI